jgi:hypothetical protein
MKSTKFSVLVLAAAFVPAALLHAQVPGSPPAAEHCQSLLRTHLERVDRRDPASVRLQERMNRIPLFEDSRERDRETAAVLSDLLKVEPMLASSSAELSGCLWQGVQAGVFALDPSPPPMAELSPQYVDSGRAPHSISLGPDTATGLDRPRSEGTLGGIQSFTAEGVSSAAVAEEGTGSAATGPFSASIGLDDTPDALAVVAGDAEIFVQGAAEEQESIAQEPGDALAEIADEGIVTGLGPMILGEVAVRRLDTIRTADGVLVIGTP